MFRAKARRLGLRADGTPKAPAIPPLSLHETFRRGTGEVVGKGPIRSFNVGFGFSVVRLHRTPMSERVSSIYEETWPCLRPL